MGTTTPPTAGARRRTAAPRIRTSAIAALLLAAAAVLVRPPAAVAGPGTAELTLDAAAVAELLEAASAEPLLLPVAAARLRLSPPWRVRFEDGEIVAEARATVEPAGWSARVEFRLTPEVEPRTGTVRLVARSVVPHLPWPVEVDVAALAPAFDLPRRLDWALELPGGTAREVTCWVQGARVEPRRLRIDLGLGIGPRGREDGTTRLPHERGASAMNGAPARTNGEPRR